MKTNIKVIATSLSLATSVSAIAGMGGLSVQSHLGQPFSGSIVVSGDEARAVIASGSVNVSGGLRASVIKQSEDRVIVRLRSTSPVREPVITFTVSAGRQTREYTAFIDPIRYTPKEAPTDDDIRANRREQNMRQNQPRTQQRDFIERKRTVVERNRAIGNDVSFDDDDSEISTAPAKKSSKVTVSSRRHRAQAGESLANIAERYRPRNMSQQSAMRALMLANPSAFKHGTTIRRNVTLYIPTESQWHAYAQRAQKQVVKERAQQARQARHTHSQGGSTSPTTIERNGVVEDVQPAQPVSKPEPVKPVAPANAEASTPKPVPTKPVPPVQPAKPASEAAPVPASKPVEAKASETNKATNTASAVAPKASSPVAQPNAQQASAPQAKAASKSQTAASAVAGSAVAAASSQVSAPAAPVARPKPVAPPPVVEEEPVEEETDYLPLILGGVGGAAVLGGAAYALSRRRKNGKADNANDDDEWEAEDNVGKGKAASLDDEWGGDMDFGPAASKASAKPQVKPTVIEEDTYFGDDEFSLDKYESQSAFQPAKKANNEFSLDSKDEFSLDKFDSFDDVAPARKSPASQDDEWTLPDSDVKPQVASSTAKNEFVEADEDDWSLDKLDAITEFGKQQSPEQTFSLDDFVVDDIQPAAKPAATVAVSAPAVEVVTPVFDDDSAALFDFSDFDNKETTPSSSAAPKANDEGEFSLDSFDDFAAPKVAEKVNAEPVAEPAFDLDDFVVESVVADKVETVVPETSSPTFNLDDFVVPAVETPAKAVADDAAFALDTFDDFVLPETNNVAQSLDDIVLPSPAETVAQTPPPANNDDFGLDLASFDDFVLPETSDANKVLDVVAAPVEETLVQAAPVSNNDDFGLDLASLDDFVLPESNQPAASNMANVADLETFVDDVVVQPAPAAKLDDDLGLDLATFEDFVMPENTTPNPAPNNNLDLNEFAAFDSFDAPAVAENNVQAASTSAALFDDTLVSGLDDFVVAENNAPISAVETPLAEPSPVVPQADDNLAFGLDTFEDFQESAAVVDAPQAPQFDDLASLDTFVVDAMAVPAASAQPAMSMGDDLAFGLDAAFDELPLPEQITEAAAPVAPADDLALANFGFEDEIAAVAVPDIQAAPILLDAPAIEEPVISLNVPAVDVGFDDLMLDVDLDSPAPVGLSQPAAVGMMDLTTGPLDAISSLDNVNLDALEVIEDVQGWQQAENANVGFVSGSVSDMTEPLEAKFELAKMYLEIDDAVAARETLRELISESTGAIQEQAKNLLADLGH